MLFDFSAGTTPVLINVPHAGCEVPEDILRHLANSAVRLRGWDEGGTAVTLHVVRKRHGTWVGVVKNQVLATVMFLSQERDLRAWFGSRLKNPDEFAKVLRAPVVKSWAEELTDQLTLVWCA